MPVQIQFRRDTAANWTSNNPTLASGELGLETDTAKFKIGDGSTAWTSLGYGALQVNTLNSPTFTGQGQEDAEIVATGFAGYTFSVKTSAIQYITADSTSDGTLNFRGDGSTTLNAFMTTGNFISCALYVTNGSTAYYPTAFQIDGSSVTPLWNGGTAPTAGNADSTDLYIFNIVKTADATFTVFATQVQYA